MILFNYLLIRYVLDVLTFIYLFDYIWDFSLRLGFIIIILHGDRYVHDTYLSLA